MTGWTALLRLGVRRDRVLLAVSVLALAVSCAGSAQATVDLYATPAAREKAAAGIDDNPALTALYGPIADVRSEGALATFKLLLLGGVFVALLAAVVVRRHTRLEEESGRAELLAATAIGRHALLTAAVVEAALASLAVGLLTALANLAVGLEPAGSIAFGLAWAGLGLSAAGISALGCQLSASTRTAGGLVAATLGAAYVVRAIGDLGPGWLTWLSPFGWASQVHAYADERWWVLLLPVGLLAGCLAGAVALAERRDLGSGLVPARPGPARGSLGSVLALDLRLHRAGLLGWALALVVLGGVLGAIAPTVADVAGSPGTARLLHRVGGPGGLVDAFLGTEFAFVALAVTAFGIAVVVRAAGEEDAGRTEELLAGGATRGRLIGSVALVALVGPVLIVLACAIGAAAAFGPQQDGVGAALALLVPAALAPLPAVWLVAALGLLLLGLRRGSAVLGWRLLAACLVLGQLGELVGLPRAVMRLSPYAHVPALPGGDFTLTPELTMTLLAALVVVLAVWRYRARDIG